MIGENERRPKVGHLESKAFRAAVTSSAIISFNGFPGHCIMSCRVCNTIA